MKYFILVVFLLTYFLSFSQSKHDYNWMFGYDYDGAMPGIEGVKLDFNESPVDVDLEEIPFWIFTANATMSDGNGELIFYSNGCSIANKNHEIMPNGDGLNPGIIHDSNCDYGYPSSPQSCLVIPVPSSESEYYLFHKGITIDPNLSVISDVLYYSYIDMTLDNGLGDIVEKNVVIVEDTLQGGELNAIKHINGEDWWLMTLSEQSNEYITLLISSNGIEGPFLQNIGLPNSEEGGGGSQVVFSPDGTKYARYNNIDDLYLYDFDRSTGLLDNFQHIVVDSTNNSGGCAFSSNARFLYVSTRNNLYQFDMEATNIEESKVLIDTFDGFTDPLPTSFYQMQLTPDCRIFMNSTNTVDKLHVIHSPNEKGLACNFDQRDIQLPSNHQRSMPHFPYYRMDTDYPICDSSLVVSSREVYRPRKQKIKVYPNPASDKVTISLSDAFQENNQLKIYDMLGQLVISESINSGTAQLEVTLDNVPSGVYFVKIEGRKIRLLNVVK